MCTSVDLALGTLAHAHPWGIHPNRRIRPIGLIGVAEGMTMAIALRTPTSAHGSASHTDHSSQVEAARWTAISAALAIAATVPLVWMLATPLSDVMFVPEAGYRGGLSPAFMIALVLTAPAAYALFYGITGELLKNRVTTTVHKATMRVAALGLVPYLALAFTALYWSSGPRLTLLVSAGLTIPVAMAVTTWASTRNHPGFAPLI